MTWFYFVLDCVFFQKATEGGVQTGKILWWNSEKHHFLVPKTRSKSKLKCLEIAQIQSITLLIFFITKELQKAKLLRQEAFKWSTHSELHKFDVLFDPKNVCSKTFWTWRFRFCLNQRWHSQGMYKNLQKRNVHLCRFSCACLDFGHHFLKNSFGFFFTNFEIIEIPLEVWWFL